MSLPSHGEDALLHDPRLASIIIENALEYAIFTLDLDGRITSWSPGAERILGYSAAEAIGMDFAVLFTEADRAADAHGTEIALALEQGRVEDSRWHLRKGGARFWANGATMKFQGNGLAGLLKIMRDETPAKLAEEQRVLLLNELNHRIKNTLATVQSIAEQTLRASEVDPAARRDLTERLIALSEAHNVLVEENWAGADLEAIVEKTISPYRHAGTDPFQVDGPTVRVSPQQAVSMALILHELTTNALKHGSLTEAPGRVAISWNLSQDGAGGRHLTLVWQESGGPEVTPPQRQGFGSRLISRTLGEDNQGRARLEYLPDGVRCVIQLPLSRAEELPILDPRAAPPDYPN